MSFDSDISAVRDLAKFTRRASDTLTREDLRTDWRLYRPRAWLFPGPDGRPRSPTTL